MQQPNFQVLGGGQRGGGKSVLGPLAGALGTACCCGDTCVLVAESHCSMSRSPLQQSWSSGVQGGQTRSGLELFCRFFHLCVLKLPAACHKHYLDLLFVQEKH